MFIMSITYTIYLVGPYVPPHHPPTLPQVGPSALVGSLVILLFYPIMGVIAAVSATLRLRVVTITDKRVGSGWGWLSSCPRSP